MKRLRVLLLVLGVAAFVLAGGKLGSNLSAERDAAVAVEAQLSVLREVIPSAQVTAEEAPELSLNLPAEHAEPAEDSEAEYVGILSIPTLHKTLPVRTNCDENLLKTSPCCYFGTISEGIVIAGHNYRAHFSGLATLEPGDEVYLEDLAGESHAYRVVKTEVLEKEDVATMTQPLWPLSLFTCTGGGEKRVTVRCEKAA